ncbi:hypothetical protein P7B02_03790 [Caulobacter segnis]|uniref:hypothetical protein n=1 Tax=Caulobacter segnis TaxID=88688 RepID=UPI00240FA185|nr:hypothetical protein [Caulobacter segnis]MDG2520654.1 hypothetical protein [Caulobacter segnis]
MDLTDETVADALEVQVVDGGVRLSGFDGASTLLTRSAAAETARRLLHAAGEQEETATYQKPLG